MSLLDTASLLLTPNAYKEGKLYSVIPSDGSGDFTFTRATTATRVNSDGLVELVPYNLLQRSEEFDNAYWLKTNSTITANSIVAPNGTLTADSLTDNTTNGGHYIRTSATAFGQNGNNTSTIYAKANTLNYLWMYFYNGSEPAGVAAWFDLSNGTVGTVQSGLTASIESVGDGWYRCSITRNFNFTAANSNCGYGVSNADNVSSYIGSNQSIYIWGAMANEGSTALPYQKTETRLNIPRLDYSNGTCPSILLEPQRTNVLQQSSSFDSVYWAKTNATITANNTIAPDGTLTADLFTETTFTNSSASMGNGSVISVSSGTTYTSTIYAKKGADKYLYLSNYYNAANRYYTIIVDLESGIITKEQAGSSMTSFSSTITSVGDGWYRISLTQTTASSQLYFISRISDSATPTIDASYGFITIPSNNNRSLYLWGAQLEVGSYATSYIPTTTASVTRNLDIASKTGISSLIGQTEGTIFLDIIFKNPISSINRPISITETNWLSGGSIRLEVTSSQFVVDIVDAGTGIGAITYLTQVLPKTRYKIAIAYKQNDCKLYVNGVDAGSDTTTSAMPTCSELYLNNLGGGFSGPYESNAFNAVALWKTRLSNDQLAQLTSL